MEKKSRLLKGFVVFFVLTLVVSALFAAGEPQPPQRNQRPDSGQRNPGGDRPQRGGRSGFDRAAMQDRMMGMMQERMGASDEEWTVIKPRLSKVMELGQDASGRGMMRMFGRSRGSERQNTGAESSAVQRAAEELQQTLEKEAPTAAEIKAKLTALRGAREKAKQDLIKAQQELRDVLTLKQEAQLVMMGMLD